MTRLVPVVSIVCAIALTLVPGSVGFAATPDVQVVPERPAAEHPDWTSYTDANAVDAVLRVGDTLWVASTGGALRWDLQARSASLYNSEQGLASGLVRDVAAAPDGVIWFATFGGVSSFDGSSWKTYDQKGRSANQHDQCCGRKRHW